MAARAGTFSSSGQRTGLRYLLPPIFTVSVIGSPTLTFVGVAEDEIVYCPTRP